MAILSNKRLLIVLVIVLLVVSGVVYAGTTREETSGNVQEDEAPEKVIHSRTKAAIDPKNERQIVGFSSDVFFGRVIERAGSEGTPTTKPAAEVPMTQYTVEVTEGIKGDVSGTVTVNQLGGYEDDGSGGDGKQLNLIDGDPLLEPGQEYLFATNYVPEEGWYQIVLNGAANVKVEDKAQRRGLKEKFEKAKLKYRPCRPDGSNPRGKDLPCDSSDPLPPGKSKYSSGQQKTSGQQKSSTDQDSIGH